MPKFSYGPAAKARTLNLLLVLLDFANDELEVVEADEDRLETLRSHIDLHWAGDRSLIVRTKLRYLETLTHLSSKRLPGANTSKSANHLSCLSKPQIKEALNHLQHLLQWFEDNRTSRRGSEIWHFTIHLGAARRDRSGIIQHFETAWQINHPRQTLEQAISPKLTAPSAQVTCQPNKQTSLPLSPPSSLPTHDWRDICQQALLRHRTELTTNALMAQDGLSFRLEDVYVPLAVLPQRVSEDAAENAEQLALSSECLLQQTDSKSSSSAIRLALIGEAGSGKTTLLQRLALLLLEQEKGIPVWVSLSELEGKSLEDYLLQDWLRGVLQQRSLPEATVESFSQQIEQGHVWLLLDAVDEMSLASGMALAKIAQHLKGWLSNSAVILTCRQNVWESGNNALTHFECYKLLDYGVDSYRTQGNTTRQLIDQWFRHQPEQAERLWNTLQRTEYQQLRTALRNPLRLALLCRTWSCRYEQNSIAGKLPHSQSLLYHQFVDAFYDWKQNIFHTTLVQRQSFNQTLGQIALHCLTSKKPRRCFSAAWLQTLSPPVNFSTLEHLLQLGWLAPAGRIATLGQQLYRFCHGTFQDYFAAQLVNQAQDFLSLTVTTTAGKKSITPLFEEHWRPVILLWLGRDEIAIAQKEELMQHLIDYPDDCGGFFEQRAHCLAAEALSEFPEFSQVETVLDPVIRWRFNLDGKTPSPLIQLAQRSLSHSHQPTVIPLLERYAQDSTLRSFDRWLIGYSLGKTYDPGNVVAIATLTELLQSADYSQHLQINLARALGLVNPGNSLAISTLEKVVETTNCFDLRKKATLRLARIAPEHPLVLPTLEQLLQQSQDGQKQPIQQALLTALEAIAPEHPLLQSHKETQRSRAQRSSRSPKPSSRTFTPPLEQLCDRLMQRLQHAQNHSNIPNVIRWSIKLGELQPGHPQAIKALLEHLKNFSVQDSKTKHQAAFLKQIGEGLAIIPTEAQIPELLGPILKSLEDPMLTLVCQRILWIWSERLGYSAFRKAVAAQQSSSQQITQQQVTQQQAVPKE